MAGNTFGTLFRLTTFGESHGPVVGGVVDGCPSGLKITADLIQRELDRRKPGQSVLVSPRKEEDIIEILSGVFEEISTGAPIAFMIRNKDSVPSDYEHLRHVFRPSHADYTYHIKYGHRDHRGGGRSSARETACRVAGGGIARLLLQSQNIEIVACTSRIGRIGFEPGYHLMDPDLIEKNPLRCPDPEVYREMSAHFDDIRRDGDSCGSQVFGIIRNIPPGLGEPVFDKFNADLAKAMFSINGCNGFEIGTGFRGSSMRGSEHNDLFIIKKDDPKDSGKRHAATLTNHSGGIQGGITNGNIVYFKVSFKPVPTLGIDQRTIDDQMQEVVLEGKGRHDSCIAPRAVPVVEAMACLVTADHYLRYQAVR